LDFFRIQSESSNFQRGIDWIEKKSFNALASSGLLNALSYLSIFGSTGMRMSSIRKLPTILS